MVQRLYTFPGFLRRRPGSGIIVCLLAALLLLPFPAGAAPASSSDDDSVLVQGYFSGKYVFRKTKVDGEPIRDEDLFSELRIDLSKPSTNSYEFHFFGTLRDDLSGNRNRNTFSPFEDIGDTYSSAVHGYLYEAHLDLNNPMSHVTQIRIGRQDGTRDEPVFFDGVAADVSITRRVSMTAYGGASADFYELSTTGGPNFLQGAGLDVLAFSSTLFSLDFLHTDDKRDFYGTENHHDQLVSVRLNQRFSPYFRTVIKARALNGQSRDMNVRLVGTAPESGFELNAAYMRQFRTENELSTELSSYYEVLGQSNPYQTYDVRLRKLFGSRVAVDAGYFERALIHRQEESTFNRAFKRYYGVFDVNDLFFTGLSVSLTGEQWKSGQQSVNTWGYDIGYAFKKGRRSTKVNAGSYYSLYKYDDFMDLGERTNVRTYYVKLEYPFAQRYTLSGGYDFEHGLEDYQTAKLGIRYDF